jgi:hypothetical protein
MYVYNFLNMVTPTPGGLGLKPSHLVPSLALFFTFGKRDPYSTLFPGFDNFWFYWSPNSSTCFSVRILFVLLGPLHRSSYRRKREFPELSNWAPYSEGRGRPP